MALVETAKSSIVFPAHIPADVVGLLANTVYKADTTQPYSTLSGSYLGSNFEVVVDPNYVLIWNDLDWIFYNADGTGRDTRSTFNLMYPVGTDPNGLVGSNVTLYKVGSVYLYLTNVYHSVYNFAALTPVSIGGSNGNAYRHTCVVDPTILV